MCVAERQVADSKFKAQTHELSAQSQGLPDAAGGNMPVCAALCRINGIVQGQKSCKTANGQK
jgi:hypothetical protein